MTTLPIATAMATVVKEMVHLDVVVVVVIVGEARTSSDSIDGNDR
jgi:hypothetical protein